MEPEKLVKTSYNNVYMLRMSMQQTSYIEGTLYTLQDALDFAKQSGVGAVKGLR